MARNLGFVCCFDDDGTAHIFAGTSTALYKLDATERAWVDVSSATYSVTERDFWSFAQFGQNIIAVTNGVAPQVYTLGSSATFANLAGSPPEARGVTVVGDFLVLYGLTDNPNRVQWSGLNDIEEWTPGTASSDYQDFPDGGAVTGVAGGEYGLVLQDNAVRRMVFNPVSATIFDFSRIVEDHGLFMPYSMVRTMGAVFYFAQDGFYKLTGQGQLTPIGANRVNNSFIADFDATSPRFLVGAADPSKHRVVWAYKSRDNGNTGLLDKLLIYDWSLDRWSTAEISVEFIGPSAQLSATLESLDALGYTVDNFPFSFDNYINSPSLQLAGFDSEHKLGFFDGDTLEALIDTPEGTVGDSVRLMVRSVRPVSDADSAYVKVATRERLGDAKVWSTETAMNFRGHCPQRVSGRFNVARLRLPAGSNWTFARGIEVDGTNMGLR